MIQSADNIVILKQQYIVAESLKYGLPLLMSLKERLFPIENSLGTFNVTAALLQACNKSHMKISCNNNKKKFVERIIEKTSKTNSIKCVVQKFQLHI